MVPIRLTTDEMLMAGVEGIYRETTSLMREAAGRPSRGRHYKAEFNWDQAVEGACAEIAVARWSNRYWSGAQFTGAAGVDVGTRGQVRWTKYPDGCLPLHPEDDDDHYFMLVIGKAPDMQIIGGIEGRAGKLEKYWRTEGLISPCFMVPQADLEPAQPRQEHT